MTPVPISQLADKINSADIIFNTIPAVLSMPKSYRTKSSTIHDISSFPYGVDFAVAERLNIKAILLPDCREKLLRNCWENTCPGLPGTYKKY